MVAPTVESGSLHPKTRERHAPQAPRGILCVYSCLVFMLVFRFMLVLVFMFMFMEANGKAMRRHHGRHWQSHWQSEWQSEWQSHWLTDASASVRERRFRRFRRLGGISLGSGADQKIDALCVPFLVLLAQFCLGFNQPVSGDIAAPSGGCRNG